MSYVIKMRRSSKNHLLLRATDVRTICGRKVKFGEIFDKMPRDEPPNLCHSCYAWIGKEMSTEWFGLDFYE